MTSARVDRLDEATADAHAWTAYAFARWRGRAAALPLRPIPAAALRRNGLAPLLHAALTRDHDPRAAGFAGDRRHAATANLLRLAEGERVRAALDAAGAAPVLLKGGAFLVRFSPGDAGVRPMADLDVLVDPNAFRASATALAAIGFVPVAGRAAADLVSHARGFVRAAGALDVEVDVHRAVSLWPQHPRLSAAIRRNAQTCRGWRIPSLPDALAHAAVHRVNHGLAWSALDLLDVRCLFEAIDPATASGVADALAATGALRATYAAILHAHTLFGDVDPREWDERLAPIVARLGARRAAAIARRVAIVDPLAGLIAGRRPIYRALVVWPMTSGSAARSLVAGLAYLPLRALDEWRATAAAGRGWRPRLTSVVRRAAVGAGTSARDHARPDSELV